MVRAPISTPAAATPQKPNIVVVYTDDQPADSLAAMNFLKSKPGGHWLEFTNAFNNAPHGGPSRPTLFTGLYPHHHGVEGESGTFNEASSVGTWLQAAGYRTGLHGKYLNEYDGLAIPPGWSDWFVNTGQNKHFDYYMNNNGVLEYHGRDDIDYQTDVVARRADSFIRSSTAQPFFLVAAPIVPHEPYSLPPAHKTDPVSFTNSPNFNEADVSDKPNWVKSKPLLTSQQVTAQNATRTKVYRMVKAADDLINTVYTALSDTGKLDNTVIVFMTDNGQNFGEHRLTNKGCVYEECVGTPMYVRVPWVPGRVEPKLVSSVDVAPTLADLAGIAPATAIDGTSLVPLFNDAGASWRSSMLLEYKAKTPNFWSIRTDVWKYVELDTGEKELYDEVSDPYELSNVAGQPAYAAIQASLATELAAMKTAPAHQVVPTVSIADASVTEGTGGSSQLDFTLTLTPASTGTVRVRASTANGTAVAPGDFGSSVQAIAFGPGETSSVFSVPVVTDAGSEPSETLTVGLDQPQGLLIADGSATGTIVDDDLQPGMSIDDVAVTEGNAGTTDATFTVSLSQAVGGTVTVSYATADGSATAPADYATTSGGLTFDPGETSKTITVPVVGETLAEPDESFTVELSNASGALVTDATGVGTITTDDPLPTVSIGDASVAEGAAGATPTASFTVSLTPAASEPVSVAWSTADGSAAAPGDYTAASGNLTFAPGETSKTVGITVIGDGVYENNETFTVNLNTASVGIADGQGVGTIQNDEMLPRLSISNVTLNEGNSGTTPATFTVTLAGPSAFPVTVSFATANGKAKAPGDFEAQNGTLTFAPGETSKTITVLVVGDTVVEVNENFQVKLSNATGASIIDATGNGTIKNDD